MHSKRIMNGKKEWREAGKKDRMRRKGERRIKNGKC